MSMLSSQADELRETADKVDKLEAWERVSVPWMQGKLAPMLREAADTIEGLRDRLQEEGDAMRDYRASQIAAEAERRLQESCESRYSKLFGTPERAARTSWHMLMCKHVDCDECPIKNGCAIATDIDCDDGEAALLEWLRGEE